VINTGLFTNRSWDIPEEIKYNKEPMNNYDSWLFEPYEKYYNEMDKLEQHLEEMRDMDEEEDQRTYCDIHGLKFYEIEEYL